MLLVLVIIRVYMQVYCCHHITLTDMLDKVAYLKCRALYNKYVTSVYYLYLKTNRQLVKLSMLNKRDL